MNNNFKILLGTIAGIMIGGLTVVGANQAIQAIQNTEIKVSLNGQVQEFRDETTGEKQYPITYHDRTYLPLRNVAQLAGLSVDYDNNSKTAILANEDVVDFQYLEKYYNENNNRINIINNGYINLERFNRSFRYYLNNKGTLLTIDASSYDMPDNKITYDLTGFNGNVKSCLAVYNNKIDRDDLKDILILALNDSGTVFALAPLSSTFVPLDLFMDSSDSFIDGMGVSNRAISQYTFTNDNYNEGIFDIKYGPSIYLKDEYGNMILLNTFSDDESFYEKDNELHIVVENNYKQLYSGIVNNVEPARKFNIRSIVFNNEGVLSNKIKKIEYWFDNESPKEISREESIPEVYLNSPYNILNIRILYNNKKYQFSYKINIKSFETVGFVEDCNTDGDYYTCKVNGVEYKGISNKLENKSIVFLVEMNNSNNFIALGNLKGSHIDSSRKISKITDDSFEIQDVTSGKITSYRKDEIYSLCSIMNYIEVDANNNIVKHEMAFSRNHPRFVLKVGDTITSESANLGLFNIFRRAEKASEEPFFTYNENTEISVSYEPDILYEDSEITYNFSNIMKAKEKLVIKCVYEGKTVEIYNNHYDKKRYVLNANQIHNALKRAYNDLNGNKIEIEAMICDEVGNIINNYSFSTYFGTKESIGITSNFDLLKENDSKIVISFSRDIKDYEDLEITFLLVTSDGGGRFVKPNLKKLSDGSIEIDVEELKQKTYEILSNKNIFNIVKDGDEVKAYNILDPDSKNYVINLNEVEISLEVQVMQWQHSGIGGKGGNDMGRKKLVNKFSLLDYYEG